MATFQVPQFIEEKPKIVGPLTLAQFFYVAGAAGIGIISFYALDSFFLSFLITALAAGVGLSLAFVEVDGQSLPRLVGAALTHLKKPKTYVWMRELPTTTLDAESIEKIKAIRRNMSLQEKIKSVTLGITTGKLPFLSKGKPKPKDTYQVVTYLTGEKGVAKRVDY